MSSRLSTVLWAIVLAVSLASANGCAVAPPDRAARIGELPTPIPGAEDVVIDARHDYAYVSCDDRRADPDKSRGVIYGVDLAGDRSPRDLTSELAAELPVTLHPHGLGFIESGEGARLFVVNHGAGDDGDQHSIEVFDVPEPGRLEHLTSITHALLTRPNDVSAASPDSFYVTNLSDGRFWGGLFGGGNSNVAWCPDLARMQLRMLDDDLYMANGVHWDSSRQRLFVTESQRAVLRSYAHHADGSLERVDVIQLDGLPDNINAGPDNTLWVASHASKLGFLFNAWFGADSDSSVEQVKVRHDGSFESRTTILTLDGEDHDAASAAASWHDLLMVGSVYDRAGLYKLKGVEP